MHGLYPKHRKPGTEANESNSQSQPYVLLHGDCRKPAHAFLVTDCNAMCEVDISLLLLSAFCTTFITRMVAGMNIHLFLQHSVLSYYQQELPPNPIYHFLA